MSVIYNQWYLINLIFIYYYEFNHIDFSFWIILPEVVFIIVCFIILILGDKISPNLLHKVVCVLLLLIFSMYIYFIICYSDSLNSIGIFDFLFFNCWIVDIYSLIFKSSIVGLTLILLILAKNILVFIKDKIINEFLLLLLFSVFFSLSLLSSNDFFLSYLSLEGMSFSLYVLSATIYFSKLSVESAIKYFILGGIASCIFSYSISLLFLITSSLDFFSIKFFFNYTFNAYERFDLIFIISGILISFLFKLSAFPCHMWTPDVYEGIWTPVTAFFAIVIKTVVFVFITRVFGYVLTSLIIIWQPLVLVSALGSIVIGCLGALPQRKIKRFLAYTSINQVGFLLLGLSINTVDSFFASILFLFVYIIMSIIFFGFILNIKHFTQNFQIIFLTDLCIIQ
jgi:NADH-quinone oxidoreductase subunit N